MKMMMIMMMMVVTLFAFLSFFTKKKPLQKRETEINCAKRLTPLSLCCDSQLVKKRGKGASVSSLYVKEYKQTQDTRV